MPYRVFEDGDEVFEVDFNAMMSQGIARFASSGARTTAIPSPVEGQYSDIGDGLERWDGSSWEPATEVIPTNRLIPSGGTTGQVLAKDTGTNYDVEWITPYLTGTATLVGGTVTVNNAAVAANSRIMLTSQVDGGTVGFLRVSGRSNGVSFTISSSSALDTSTVAWLIINP